MKGTVAPPSRRSIAAWTGHSWTLGSPAIPSVIDCNALPSHWGALSTPGRAGGRGRTLEDVFAFSNADIERVHDFIQWLFPLPTRSAAQPGSPVLSPDDIAAIRSDSRSLANLDRASARMLSFYRETSGWLARDD